MIEKKSTIEGDKYVLRTIVGEFQIPVGIVTSGLLQRVMYEVSEALNNKYSVDEFKDRLRYVVNISGRELNILADFYKKLLELEREGKDRIWVSIIRNAFAPMLRGKFDYVVGNPPWVRWEELPESYREITRDLWETYGILGKGAGFKRDLAMLFLARCFDLYLKPGGKLAFLMPFTVFKTQAGSGFRKFLATKTKIHVVHDLVTTYPFEGAVNRTSAIVVEKVCDDLRNCPDSTKLVNENRKIKHVIWVSEKAVPTDMQLEEVLKTTKRCGAVMTPLVERDPSSPWMQISEKVLPYIRKLIGKSQYEAHAGVLSGLDQVYYVKIKGRRPDGKLVIMNPPETGQKKKVEQIDAVVEPDLVYPLIRGRDVMKWFVEYRDRYIVLPHDSWTGKPLTITELKQKYPDTYGYLYKFKEELKSRSIKPFLSLRNAIRKAKSGLERQQALNKLEENFYIVDNIGPYTFAPYKVVWKRIAGAITGKAVSFECAVVEPMSIKLSSGEVVSGPKPIVPDDSIILLDFDKPDEAYYVCGVLNSIIVRTIIASYTYELRQETHILEYVNVPKYNPNNPIHNQISQLSRRAHEIARCIYSEDKPQYCSQIQEPEKELERVENEIDKLVANLYDIPMDVLNEIKAFLKTLSGK
ncbi:MAG: class I SAM-dependent DNA methyltransferase, partial [Thermosphaera sp.]